VSKAQCRIDRGIGMNKQIGAANLLAMRSLATQAKDSAGTTLGNMEALVSHYVALQTENIKLRADREYMVESLLDIFPSAHRLALELECLLLSCTDTCATAKWWESAHEALEQWQKLGTNAWHDCTSEL